MLRFKYFLIENTEENNLYNKLFQAVSGKNSTGRDHYSNTNEVHQPYVMTSYEEGYDPEVYGKDAPQTNKIKWNNYHEAANHISAIGHLNKMFYMKDNSSMHFGDLFSSHAQMLEDLTDESSPHFDSQIASLITTIKDNYGHDEEDINTKLMSKLIDRHVNYYDDVLPRTIPLRMKTLKSVMEEHLQNSKNHPDAAFFLPLPKIVQHPDYYKEAPKLEIGR